MRRANRKNTKVFTLHICCILMVCLACSAVNIFASRYYRLLEKERKIFLGFRGIDSLAAVEYITLETVTERTQYYEAFWFGRSEHERQEFEKRIEYAHRVFGKHAPLSDDRIPIYVKHGEPSIREEISPKKKIAVKIKESVKPAEIWTYYADGLIFDFIRIARAYKLIAESEFGERVNVPFLQEVVQDTNFTIQSMLPLEFNVTTARYRQKKNLTRLEVYLTVEIDDTTGSELLRSIKVFNTNDSLVQFQSDLLKPTGKKGGLFFDQVNFWLDPELYRLEIQLTDLKNKQCSTDTIQVSLIDYQDDGKEISDLIVAKLIDDIFTHYKFEKPVGRVIPLIDRKFSVHTPFYLYAEAYNLHTKNGEHTIRITYEVYNKEKMRQEVVDAVIENETEVGEIAYLATEYHPMDLDPGVYMIVLRVEDLFGGKERTAVCEFELVE